MTQPRARRRPAPALAAAPDGDAAKAFHLSFDRATWRAVKMLAAARDTTVRDLLRAVVREELERAVKAGILPAALVPHAARSA